MRRSERLKKLRKLYCFPSIPGFTPNIQFVGQDDPQRVAETQKPLTEWGNQVRALMTNDKHRQQLGQFQDRYQDRNTPDEKRQGIADSMIEVIGQEIHDLEDAEPHWTIVPTFWLVIVGIVVGVAAALISWLAWHQAVQPPTTVSSSTATRSGSAFPSPSTASAAQTHSSTQSAAAQAMLARKQP